MTFKVPPTASTLVREALRRLPTGVREQEGTLPPAAWVRMPEPVMRHLRASTISVTADDILRALDDGDRTADLISSCHPLKTGK